jgi:bifunctional non-homologous end joining protein LigD
LPQGISPALATLTREVPAGDGWLHEVKYDGYRILARIDAGKVTLFSRNARVWNAKMPSVVSSLGAVKAKSAWLDGEVCVMDKLGVSSFQALQNALANPKAHLLYFAFDLLYLDGQDLRGAVLVEHKRALERLLAKPPAGVLLSGHVQGQGRAVLDGACKAGLEGVVSKWGNASYPEGLRSKAWLKVKCILRQEMVVGGYTDPQGSRTGFGALLLGVYEGKELRYAGKVGTGFNERLLAELFPRLQALEQAKPAFVNPPRGFEAKGAHWMKPQMVVEVAFTEWTDEGTLRHPSFQGLREDKKAKDVVRERPS